MDKNYYVPEILDLKEGYECEIHSVKLGWKRYIIGDDYENITYSRAKSEALYGENIRVPYLTKEQIEAEGWKWKEEDGDDFEFFFTKDGWDILWIPTTKFIAIDKENEPSVFWGKCPSVNEFRFITKLLGINAA